MLLPNGYAAPADAGWSSCDEIAQMAGVRVIWRGTPCRWRGPRGNRAVRHREGLVHGFLTLKTQDGALVATGDLTQHVSGDRVTTRLTYRFEDGSTHDETTVFSQRGQFRLVTNHLVQKGPTFTQPLDMSIDVATGRVTVRYKDDKGAEKVETERLELPADVSNGMVPTLLKNVVSGRLVPALSYVAATPKPRLVKLAISSVGADLVFPLPRQCTRRLTMWRKLRSAE